MKLVKRSRLIYRSRVEYGSFGINHYSGCAHGCKYCSSMFRDIRFRHCRNRQDWMRAQPVKNAVRQVEDEYWTNQTLQAQLHDGQSWVWLCPATDPYQPLEDELCITSRILKHLVTSKVPVRILTKSESVCNDEDTIIRHSDLVQVGFTITTLDDDLALKWEPEASMIHDRIKTLRYFHANGVKTWLSDEPILKADHLELLEALKDDVDQWIFGKDNYMKRDLPYPRIRDEIIQWFQAHNMTNYLIKKELMGAT